MIRRRWFPWAVYAGTVVSLVPIALLLYVLGPEEGDAGVNCGGIGWGEVPCGWDSVGLAFVLVGIPYMTGYAAVLGLSELLGGRFTSVRSCLALVGSAVPWALLGVASFTVEF